MRMFFYEYLLFFIYLCSFCGAMNNLAADSGSIGLLQKI